MEKELKTLVPIQTEYKGILFRSRLEARWAVFFDCCGADWEYEPQGYECEDGTRYLPDFLLHNVRFFMDDDSHEYDVFVEIKGNLTDKDVLKITNIRDGEPIINKNRSVGNIIAILGNIPFVNSMQSLFNEELMEYKKTCIDGIGSIGMFSQVKSGDDRVYTAFPAVSQSGKLIFATCNGKNQYNVGRTLNTYYRARSARFEYGEKPMIVSTAEEAIARKKLYEAVAFVVHEKYGFGKKKTIGLIDKLDALLNDETTELPSYLWAELKMYAEP